MSSAWVAQHIALEIRDFNERRPWMPRRKGGVKLRLVERRVSMINSFYFA